MFHVSTSISSLSKYTILELFLHDEQMKVADDFGSKCQSRNHTCIYCEYSNHDWAGGLVCPFPSLSIQSSHEPL